MSMEPPSNSKKLRKLVSDHAVVRYVERVHGIDCSDIRREILRDGVYSAIKAGASRFQKDGVEFVLKDGLVVTIIGGNA